jgi:hypothetical protein
MMHTRSSLLAVLLALLVVPGCGAGELGDEESGAAFEPDEDEGRQVFSVGLAAGTAAEVCKTGGSGLNVRTGPSTSNHIIRTIPEGHRVKILATAGSWYKTDEGGFSYGYYLCAAGSTGGGGDTSGGGGGGGGGGGCTGSFINPAPGYPVTSEFGPRWGSMHEGIDVGVPMKTSLKAADGGVVEFAGWLGGYGYAIDINHCGKYTTRFGHNTNFIADHGQKVSKGQYVSHSGSTGNSTGPHVHFEIRIGGRWGKAVNPRNYVHF